MGDCGSVGPAERLCPYCTHKSDHDDKAADHDQKPCRRQAGKGRFVSEGDIYRIWDSQIVDNSLGELQADLADLRVGKEEKGKHKGACEQQFWIFSLKSQLCGHAFQRLKNQVSKKQRPPRFQQDLLDLA